MAAAKVTNLRLTPAAQQDLRDIWVYTVDTWSMMQADRYLDIINDTFEQLMFMPEMARERIEFTPPVRIHPSGEHLIVYRIEGDHLDVLRILGAGQNWQALLRDLDA